jgi:OmpA-OmpF porin, OOP family
MKSTFALRILSGAVLAALTAASAAAQESPYFYAGGGVGRSRANFDENQITANLLGGGLTTTGISQHERDTAYKFFGGYQFNRYFGLEAGYFNLGKFGFTSTTVPAGTLTGNIKLRGGYFDVVGTLPITEKFAASARIGAQYARTYDAFTSTGAVNNVNYYPNVSTRKTNYKAGVGLQYAFSPSFILRGEAERYRIDGVIANHTNVNVYSVSLVFPFGASRKAPPAPVNAPEPAYVAPTPPPPPPPVITPPPVTQAPQPVVISRASFSAESLFGFDQSNLKPEGKSSLDKFVKDIQGTQFDMINVEGHADRLGSVPYNQRLSLRRAESVKSYLVTSGRMDSAKITAMGKGESSPVTQPDQCKGTKVTPSLIACLQPDRRVDVLVTVIR